MFQTFDSESDPSVGRERVGRLREWLDGQDLDGFLVPRADEHQGEYVAPGSERLRWLTGFAGSAGVALILREPRASSSSTAATRCRCATRSTCRSSRSRAWSTTPPPAWIGKNLGKGARIGFDPWLHTIGDAKALRAAAEKVGANWCAVDRNPIDEIVDRPAGAAARPGRDPSDRVCRRARQGQAGAACRRARQGRRHACGAHRPVVDRLGLQHPRQRRAAHAAGARLRHAAAEGPHLLFIDKRKLPIETEAYLTQLADLRPPSALEAELARLAAGGARIALDPALAAEQLRTLVEANGGTVVAAADPARLPRATKNQTEIAGTRAAHRRDGAAVAKMLAWLDRQAPGSIDEITAVDAARGNPPQTGEETQMPLRDVSFDTISGAGPNGAIMHYRVSRATNRTLGDGRAVPDRFRRAVPGRHDRHHPHRRRRHSRPTRCASATRSCSRA